ncbi:protein RAE1 [Citrus sinensis]|uniref:Protein RAE1 n=1 Tax=Citrus sinensis TaxID=2711 RepID=A0ACB8JD35_CITSI|nr:protein RAE1 [Citrus sinensis]
MATFGAAAVATNQNPNNSIEVSQPPNDSVSSLCFSPKANILVATSWDNQVRSYAQHERMMELLSSLEDVTSRSRCGLCSLVVGQPVTVAMHDAPIKEVTWIPEMNLLATGSWDKTLKSLRCAVECNDLAKWDNMCMWIVKCISFRFIWYLMWSTVYCVSMWCLVLSDTRQPNPVHTQQLPDRCHAFTVRYQLMVVGTADRNLVVFNLQNPQLKHVFCVAAAAATLVVG